MRKTALFMLLVFMTFTSVSAAPKVAKIKAKNIPALNTLIQKNIDDKLFSGAQIAVFRKGEKIYEKNAGKTAFEKGANIAGDTVFDLASLTKPLVTLAVTAYSISNGKMALDDPLAKYIPAITKEITLRQLVTHTSGLPAYEPFFWKFNEMRDYADKKQAIIDFVEDFEERKPDKYSDINYIVLGFILEGIYGKRLDAVFKDILDELKYPGVYPEFQTGKSGDPKKIAATSVSKQRKTVNQGVVDDENCYFLDGVSGHAGLFASADTVGSYIVFLLKQDWFKPFIAEATGFDKPKEDDSCYGKTVPEYCFGHLGYTGTAFLIDPKSDTVFVVLTNRTHPSDEKKHVHKRIKAFRQEAFDILLNNLKK